MGDVEATEDGAHGVRRPQEVRDGPQTRPLHMMTLSGDLLGDPGPGHPDGAGDVGGSRPSVQRRVVLASPRERPAVDPHVDTISIGLRKFNIGTVPASVTPPSTWRHAAGFTLAASVTALAGLAVLSAAVAATSGQTGEASAVPAPPSDGPAASTHSGNTGFGRHRMRPHVRARGPVQNAYPAGRGARHVASANASGPRQEAASGAMVAETRAFYREVATDPAVAYRRTGGALHARGRQALRNDYGGVFSISLETITADPGEETTTSTMRLRYTDGTSRRVTRVCHFTSGTHPRIADDGT
jgi:hypothetical protein